MKSISRHITSLVINTLARRHTHTQIYISTIETGTIFRNQVHTGLCSVCVWFKNHKRTMRVYLILQIRIIFVAPYRRFNNHKLVYENLFRSPVYCGLSRNPVVNFLFQKLCNTIVWLTFKDKKITYNDFTDFYRTSKLFILEFVRSSNSTASY